jgi:serine/threonine-protein kinase
LKPANVFLHSASGAASIKLLDFGVAKIVDPDGDVCATGTDTMLGTPAYMAPEQWGGSSTSAASDIYSLGVIAYELLTGQRPHRGSTTPEVIKAHLFEEPAPASAVNPTLPISVDRALAAMLAKRPFDRPVSAREAIASLRRAVFDEPHAVPEPAPRSPAPTRGWRRGAAMLLVASALATGAWWTWRLGGTEVASSAKTREVARAQLPTQPVKPLAPNVPPSPPPPLPAEPQSSKPEPAPVQSTPAQVTLTVQGAPARAVLFLNGVELDAAGGSLRVPQSSQPITLRIESGGAKPQSYTVVPDRDRVIVVKRARAAAPGPRKATASSELEF